MLLGLTLTGADAPVGFSPWSGPGISLALDCRQRVLTVLPGAADVDCESKSTDFGIIAGATVSFPISDTSALFVNGGGIRFVVGGS